VEAAHGRGRSRALKVEFYRRLFGAEPAKRRPGYANFAIADPPLKLVLFEGAGEPGTLNHLGVEVTSTEKVAAEATRLESARTVRIKALLRHNLRYQTFQVAPCLPQNLR
jgi:catechol 2,3-dioxygenase-like lactoylglutathione lyase family enzyme